MPNHSALAVANEFLRMAPSIAYDQMKLQKLVYIAQGWNLAINDAPLVKDAIEAWDGGPVFRSIWNEIRDFGLNKYNPPLLINPLNKQPYQEDFLPEEKAVIDHVMRKYGAFSGKSLSDMTHQKGTPWYNAYMKSRNWPITISDIKEHYLKLAEAGRNAAAANT